MTNPSKRNDQQGPDEAAETEQTEGPTAEETAAAEESAAGEPPFDEGETQQAADETQQAAEEDAAGRLEAEVAELKDQLLRALAETENVRRRAQREREDTAKFAAAPIIKDFLSVADNLSRALDSVSAEVASDERLQPLIDGIRLTEKELLNVFERHHISKIEPQGERLDPHFHEAMFEVDDPSRPAGTVVQVLQPGYRLHDRLLRPARVGVSRGGGPAGANDNDGKPGSHIDTSA